MTNNPYHWLHINPEIFYGEDRENLIVEISQGLLRGESFALIGGRRIGKTTFLRRLERELKRNGYLDVFYYDIQSMPLFNTSDEAFKWMIGEDVSHQFLSGIESVKRFIEERLKKGFIKVVWLIDEFDSLKEFPWHLTFFNNLRALLHNTPGVSGKLVVVLSGARLMQSLRDSPGSPLANVLSWKYLFLLNEKDIYRFVNEPTDNRFPPELSSIIWKKTGGHPFLIQFLMHHVVSESDQRSYKEILESSEKKLFIDYEVIFKQWWFDHLSEEERIIFRSLEVDVGSTLDEIVQHSGLNKGIVRSGLTTLSYIGLVRQEEDRYFVAGTICHQWVRENDIIEENISAPTASLHELFDELEKRVRQFVTNKLTEWGELENLPKIFPDQISKAKEIYKKDKGDDIECPLEIILWYSDFGFPLDIMLRFWKLFYESFDQEGKQKILSGDINKAKQRFEERKDFLIRIRNALRHGRSIPEDDKDKARVFCRDIIKLCSTFKK